MPSPQTPPRCCPHYHLAVELVGRRWSGAILAVLLDAEPLRFGQIGGAVPGLSDRMLAARVRELEEQGLVTRSQHGYALTDMGRELAPAIRALRAWADRWIAPGRQRDEANPQGVDTVRRT